MPKLSVYIFLRFAIVIVLFREKKEKKLPKCIVFLPARAAG